MPLQLLIGSALGSGWSILGQLKVALSDMESALDRSSPKPAITVNEGLVEKGESLSSPNGNDSVCSEEYLYKLSWPY